MKQTTNTMYPRWAERAMTPGTGHMTNPGGEPQTVFTETAEFDGRFIVYPTIRMGPKGLYQMHGDDAFNEAVRRGDFLEAKTMEEANSMARQLSEIIFNSRPDIR